MLFNSCCYPCIWRVLYHSSGMVQWWGRGVFGSEGARAGSCEVGFLQTLGLSEAGLAGAFGCYKRWASPRLGVSRGGVLQTLGLFEAGGCAFPSKVPQQILPQPKTKRHTRPAQSIHNPNPGLCFQYKLGLAGKLGVNAMPTLCNARVGEFSKRV